MASCVARTSASSPRIEDLTHISPGRRRDAPRPRAWRDRFYAGSPAFPAKISLNARSNTATGCPPEIRCC